MKKNKVFLGLGTNLGELENNIIKSKAYLEEFVGEIGEISSLYKSSALGFSSENDFLNLVVEINTTLNARDLLIATQKIEKLIGRTSKSSNGIHSDRVIDIDILYFNLEIINQNDLKIPHPKIKDRKFVLIPLKEIAPKLIDPLLNIHIDELLINCSDVSNISKIIAYKHTKD